MTDYTVITADEVFDNLFGLGFTGWAIKTTKAGRWQNAPEPFVMNFIDGHSDRLDQVAQVAFSVADARQLRIANFVVLQSMAKRGDWAVGPVGDRYQVVHHNEECADFATLAEAIGFIALH